MKQMLISLIALWAVVSAEFRKEFDEFRTKYQKSYETSELEYRYEIFKNNYETIQTHNAKNLSWNLEVNEWADLSWDEFRELKLGYYRNSPKPQGLIYDTQVNLPASIDWRSENVVNAIKDQQQCGSCWAFSAVGAIESAVAIKTGKLYSLSEQQLVDCSGSYGNYGCGGGLMDSAFQYVETNGLCSEQEYPYTAQDGTCQTNCKELIKIKGFVDVQSGNETALQVALVQQPVSVAIEADQAGFQFYSSGIFDGECGTNLDHGVVLVGYGTEDGKDYWLVRNSWGNSWGDSGYIKLIRGKNQCGILLEPSYPVV